MKVWLVECMGISSVVVAETRARARFIVAWSAYDSGWAKSMKDALKGITSSKRDWHRQSNGVKEGCCSTEFANLKMTRV